MPQKEIKYTPIREKRAFEASSISWVEESEMLEIRLFETVLDLEDNRRKRAVSIFNTPFEVILLFSLLEIN